MSDDTSLSKIPASLGAEPQAALACPDLMFMERLQRLVRSAGYKPLSARSASDLEGASVLVVSLMGRHEWEPLIREAARRKVPVVAFGPHMDTEGRKRAKEAGAIRVLANGNLPRDLPGILTELREGRKPAVQEEPEHDEVARDGE
jgi:hypothetical protein